MLVRRYLALSIVAVKCQLFSRATFLIPLLGLLSHPAFASAQEVEDLALSSLKPFMALAQEPKAQTPPEVIVLFEPPLYANQSIEEGNLDEQSLAFQSAAYAEVKDTVLFEMAPQDIKIVRDYSHLPLATLQVNDQETLNQLLSNPSVKAVYRNPKYRPFLSQSLALIEQPEVIANGLGGAGTTVAVLDTGVDYTNPAFGDCTAPGIPEGCKVVHAQDFGQNDGALDDHPRKHGTNVAGIVLGVAPDTQIAALDVFRSDLAYGSDILAAVNWAIENQAKYNIVALNLSLGGGRYNSICENSFFATAFAHARAVGIIPVIASGNNGYTDSIASPACAPGAVRVGAVYDQDRGAINWGRCRDDFITADTITCFTNRASFLTLLAPGVGISAAGITMSGTSQATPHVTGAIAVLRAPTAFPDDSPAETIQRLVATGITVSDPESGLSFPRLDLAAAAFFSTFADTDGDGIFDHQDNCIEIANPDQRDSNGDGFGNACDADLDNNGYVSFNDLELFKAAFNTNNADADFDGSGFVSFNDLAIFRQLFNKPPGPAGKHP